MEKKSTSPKIKPNRHVRQLRLEAKIDGRKSIKKKAIFSMPVAPAIADDDAAGFVKMFKAPIIPVEPKIEQTVTPPEPVIPVITEEPVAPEKEKGGSVAETTPEEEIAVKNENKENIRESKIIDGKGKESLLDSMEEFTLETGDSVVAGSDKGVGGKEHNEDRAVVCPKENLVMIIDGVGGSSNGERAAQILAEKTKDNPSDLEKVIKDAVDEIESEKLGDAGAVFISGKIIEKGNKKFLDISQIGDCKVLVIKKSGEIRFESEDESPIQDFVDKKIITPDMALYANSKYINRSSVKRAVSLKLKNGKYSGYEKNSTPKTYTQTEVEEGDIILLYSDGVSDNITPGEIAAVKHENNFSPKQLFKWISDKTTERMKNAEEIISDSDRREGTTYKDGFLSMPKKDNRSLAIIEIKNNGKQTTSPESAEAVGELSEEAIANLSDEQLAALLAQYEEEEVVSAEKPEAIPESRPDTETVTMMIRGRQETAFIDSLIDKEKKDIFSQTEIHGDEFDGKKLTLEILQENGLLPEKKITIDGNTIWFSSEPYDLSGGRIAIVAYVKDKNNKITARSYYRSNSQGVWRYLPSYLIRDGKINWYHKGHSEESITLPAICQMALAQITEGQKAKKVSNPELVFAGTAKDIMHYKEGTYLSEIKQKPIDFGFSSKQGKKLDPEEISFSGKNSELSPDFYTGKTFAKWTQNSDKYGQIEIEVLPSKDGKLKFMFCRDKKNRVWIGGIENDSKTGSTGLKETWVNGGDLTTPALEYVGQTDGYGNLKMSSGEYVDMFTNYLSKIPIIIEYCRSRIIPLPVPPPKRDAEPNIAITKDGTDLFASIRKQQNTPIVISTEAKPAQPDKPDLNKRINMPIPTPKPPEAKKPEDGPISEDDIMNKFRNKRFY